jgi:nitroimidazol reductase NimA-like FMN-containing flavoprotein (pyridoxamine 5'-phosphate oxidase superfamily)
LTGITIQDDNGHIPIGIIMFALFKSTDMFGEMDRTQIQQLLSRQILGRLGCHANGLTYIVPVSYVYDNGIVYCHTQEGQKLTMLRLNPRVCLQVDNTADLANWQSVICWGVFEELKKDEERLHALTVLNQRSFPMQTSGKMRINREWPFIADNAADVDGVFFRIVIDKMTGRFEESLSRHSQLVY